MSMKKKMPFVAMFLILAGCSGTADTGTAGPTGATPGGNPGATGHASHHAMGIARQTGAAPCA